MHCEPAASIIKRLGGVSAVASIVNVEVSTVQRWRTPKEKGGTGGVIPHWHFHPLINAARKNGAPIDPQDFAPVAPKRSRAAA